MFSQVFIVSHQGGLLAYIKGELLYTSYRIHEAEYSLEITQDYTHSINGVLNGLLG